MDRAFSLYDVEFEPIRTLKGELRARRHFWLYLDESEKPRSVTPAFDHTVGHRSILFLREEGGRLRPLEDLLNYSVRVHGDSIPQWVSESNEYGTDHYIPSVSADDAQAGFAIARAVLTPDKQNAEAFAQSLRSNVGIAQLATSARYTVRILRGLLKYSEKQIRDRACLALTEDYLGQGDCVESLPDLPPSDRARMMSRLTDQEHQITGILEHNPMQGLVASNHRMEVLDRLELLRSHRSRRVRRLACAAIDRFYPEPHIERCSDADR